MVKYVKASSDNIIYEDDLILVKSTGRDYDFIATIETVDDSDYTGRVKLTFLWDYEELDPIIVEPNDWVGILADTEGYETVEAIKSRSFTTDVLD